MNFKVEHKPHDEVLKIIDNLAKEYIFVYTKETDRTRFIMTVLGKCVDAEDPDMIDRGVLVFEKGYDEEFTMGVMLEIADFLRDVIDVEDALYI